MEAIKFTVSIKIEALSMDSVGNLLNKLHERLNDECSRGWLVFEDGDMVKWETQATPVEF